MNSLLKKQIFLMCIISASGQLLGMEATQPPNKKRRIVQTTIQTNPISTLLDLPQNAIDHICAYLPALKDVAHVRKTCKHLKNAWDHNRELWLQYEDITTPNTIELWNERLKNCRNPIGIVIATSPLDIGPSNYNLTELSSDIGQFKNLRLLYLVGNDLSQAAFVNISKLSKLESLDLSCCNLTEFPIDLSQLKNIRKLNLSSNPLTQAALVNVCKLPKLEILNLRDCNLTELPSDISQLKNLSWLDLAGNSLTQAALVNICKLSNLEILDLFDCYLKELPADIGQLKKLRQLHLTRNPLSQIAIVNISKLPNLEVLNLCNCNLTELPADISQLKNLRELYLGGNQLSQTARANITAWLPNTKIIF